MRAIDPGTNDAKEEQTRKLTYALAAAATLAIGAPTIANAAGFGLYVGDPGYSASAMPGRTCGTMVATAAGIAGGTTTTAATTEAS
jgi:hypothetical protein